MNRVLGLCIGLTACGSSISINGNWTGECVTETATGGEDTYDIEIELSHDGSDVSGPAVVTPSWAVEPFDGTASGSIEDNAVDLALDMGDINVGFVLTLKGDATDDGAKMSGDCFSEIDAGTFSLTRAAE